MIFYLTILTGKNQPETKLHRAKSMNVDISVVGTSNQLFKTGSYIETKLKEKIKINFFENLEKKIENKKLRFLW